MQQSAKLVTLTREAQNAITELGRAIKSINSGHIQTRQAPPAKPRRHVKPKVKVKREEEEETGPIWDYIRLIESFLSDVEMKEVVRRLKIIYLKYGV